MTCIVGLKHGGQIFIGADSASVGPNVIHATNIKKVFRRNAPDAHGGGEMLIAVGYSFRVMQIMRYNFTIPPIRHFGQSNEAYFVQEFVPAIRDCLSEHGVMGKDKDGCDEGATMLIGFRGELFSLQYDFQVNFYQDGLAAIGSGEMYALGAMAVTTRMKPEKRIMSALGAAGRFEPGVCAPYQVEVL